MRANLKKITQRFYCHDCKRTFVLRKRKRAKYSGDLFFEIVKRHIEDRFSYRVIAKRLQETTHSFISTYTIFNYVKIASLNSLRLIDILKRLDPSLTGFLHLDGKYIKLKGQHGHQFVLFIAQDSNGLPIHQTIMEGENRKAIEEFLEQIQTKLNYPFKGIISDMQENIIAAIHDKMLGIPHQFCLTHILRNIDEITGYRHYYTQMVKLIRRLRSLQSVFVYPYEHKTKQLYRELRNIKFRIKETKSRYKTALSLRRRLRIYVLSDNPYKVNYRIALLRKMAVKFSDQKKIKTFINSLIEYKDNIFCHLKHKFMPYTNNLLENLIRQYERRLKTIEGFGSDLKAINGYLNLMGICHCFKPYTDCREHNKYKNGKSPLQIAGASTTALDWVKIALK